MRRVMLITIARSPSNQSRSVNPAYCMCISASFNCTYRKRLMRSMTPTAKSSTIQYQSPINSVSGRTLPQHKLIKKLLGRKIDFFLREATD